MVIQKCKCGTPLPEFAAFAAEYTCPNCGRQHLVGDMIQRADVLSADENIYKKDLKK